MATLRRARLPTDDEVWARVREFAVARANDGHPVPTLREGVVNTIARVDGVRIVRVSAQGRSNTTPILRGELLRVWRDLASHGETRKPRPNYFTLALLQAALADFIDDRGDGSIALRHWSTLSGAASNPPPSWRSPERPFAYAEDSSLNRRERPPSTHDRNVELRESDAHWNIKHYIHTFPNQALESLTGGPWSPSALELQLRVPTADRVDVIVRDGRGHRVLIEVKPNVGENAIGVYAQASKYRAMWRVLHDLRSDQVRCVLAAPSIPTAIAEHMVARHGIESAAVVVPPGYVAPPR